tara:strand:+ start:3140 stop:3421 length:282 start_codon:yes stop_codon:yes gene_type:complete
MRGFGNSTNKSKTFMRQEMEITPIMFWNVILTLVIAPALWTFRSLITEVKRIDILLNRTREDFATKAELVEDMNRVMEALHRVEDKLDRVLQR